MPGCRQALNRVLADAVLIMPGGHYTGESQALLNKTAGRSNLGWAHDCVHLIHLVGTWSQGPCAEIL